MALPTRSRRLLPILVLLVLMAGPAAAGAAVVSQTMPNGRVATADYRAGRADLPAILIVHGFLQTREFSTVAALANTLADLGYTVLAPTLTLNVSRRRASLPCEAVHTHDFGMDVAEIAAWSRWLEDKGHRRIVLAGHSHGALAILPYLAKPAPGVRLALLIGLTDVDQEFTPRERARRVKELEARIARGDRSLVDAPYTFCRRYVATPAALLSFVRITREDVLRWLAASRVPVLVLLGEKDDRVGRDWAALLTARGVPVRVLPGASHFFDGPAEFDLHDAVIDSLNRMSR